MVEPGIADSGETYTTRVCAHVMILNRLSRDGQYVMENGVLVANVGFSEKTGKAHNMPIPDFINEFLDNSVSPLFSKMMKELKTGTSFYFSFEEGGSYDPSRFSGMVRSSTKYRARANPLLAPRKKNKMNFIQPCTL
jgi:hypothetical protein